MTGKEVFGVRIPSLPRSLLTPAAAVAGVAAVAAFGGGFALARATASSGAAPPSIRTLHAARVGLALPRLSRAAEVPALAKPAPQPVVEPAPTPAPTREPTPAPAPKPKPKPISRPKRKPKPKPKPLPPVSKAKPPKPVVIVGSG
jgi:outer membrane biosynthesis protein TonB